MTKRDAGVIATLAETVLLLPILFMTAQTYSEQPLTLERIGFVMPLGLFCLLALQVHASAPFRDWVVQRLARRQQPAPESPAIGQ